MKNLRKAGRIAWSAIALSLVAHVSEAQVGIGITIPQAKLHVHDGSIYGTTPDLPAEQDPFWDPDFPSPIHYTLKWYHDKSALRSVGERIGTGTLDPQNVGVYSFASGYETFAIGVASTAFGVKAVATDKGAFANGVQTEASGYCAFAHGELAKADGHRSIAIGTNVGNNKFSGSFILGDDYSSGFLMNDAAKQMKMRFAGGYKLYTNSLATIGVQIAAGGNAWQVISDVNKKENFARVNGEEFLQKISKMNLTSWNYKGQDPKTFRHYGPMAQDMFAAFGKDEYGTVGTDTTINQADFDGINLIAIQALIHKMDQINSDLRQEIASLKAQLAVRGGSRKSKLIMLSKK